MVNNACEILIEAAQPDLYRINSFRILELPVEASAQDIANRCQIINKYSHVGLSVPHGSGTALPLPDSTNPNSGMEAKLSIQDPERRIIDEFFWFWPSQLNGSTQDAALAALANNHPDEARDLWISHEREQSEANISIHNLAVFYHASALDLEHLSLDNQHLSSDQANQRDDYWLSSFDRWKKLLEQENFWTHLKSRIRDLDDPRLTTGMAKRMRDSLPLALLMINAHLAVYWAEANNQTQVKRQLSLMEISGFDQTVIDEALRQAISPIRQMIKSLGQNAESEAASKPELVGQIVRKFHQQAKPNLDILDCLLPQNNRYRILSHDEVAKKMSTILFSACNQTGNWSNATELLELASTISLGNQTRSSLENDVKVAQSKAMHEVCWFCKKRKGNPSDSLEIKMYGEVTKTPTYQSGNYGTRISWRYKTIQIPRCKKCKGVHQCNKDRSVLIALIISGFAILMCIFIALSEDGGTKSLLALPILLMLSIILLRRNNKRMKSILGDESKKDIRPEKYQNQFPEILELQKNGWQFGEKPPDVQ